MNCLRPFETLTEAVLTHRLTLPKGQQPWRLVAQSCTGEINGLGHRFRGIAFATDGLFVALLTSGNAVLLGHLEWFVKDSNDPSETDLFSCSKPKPAAKAAFVAGLEHLF